MAAAMATSPEPEAMSMTSRLCTTSAWSSRYRARACPAAQATAQNGGSRPVRPEVSSVRCHKLIGSLAWCSRISGTSGTGPSRVPAAISCRLGTSWAMALDDAFLQGQPGQVGAAAAAALVADPVQVSAHGTDADEELLSDLGVGPALGNEGDQLAFPGAEPGEPGLPGRRVRDVLARGDDGELHRRRQRYGGAAALGRGELPVVQRPPGLGQRPLAVPRLLQRCDQPGRLALGRYRRPQGDRLGGPPGRRAQVTALLDHVDH